MRQAEADHKHARSCITLGHYEWACFLSQLIRRQRS
ncbi:MAG: HEPN domain-containing protein [Bacillota bacterium]